jgi:hypothetical protein
MCGEDNTSPFCWNSRRWLVLTGFKLNSCPYKNLSSISCLSLGRAGCGYYEDRPPSKYFLRQTGKLITMGVMKAADPGEGSE